MKHEHSTRNAGVASVVTPSARALVASLAVVVLGPLLGIVVYTHPMLAVGGVAGLVARPALGLSRRASRQITRFAERTSSRPQVAAAGASLDAGAE